MHGSRLSIFSIVLLGALVTAADTQPLPTQVLFIGNSLTFWNEGLWTHLQRMAVRGTPTIEVSAGQSVFPGAFFKSLWERREPREAIRKGRYDVVVLQEDLPETKVADFREHARRFVAEVRQSGARPVLLMAWAYPRLGWITMGQIAQAHREAAAELNVDIAPAGLAWQRVMQERPSLNLYAPDREHPSMAGTYLTTAVLYATLFGKNPSSSAYRANGISDEDGAFLRRIAWETVQSQTSQLR